MELLPDLYKNQLPFDQTNCTEKQANVMNMHLYAIYVFSEKQSMCV